MSRKRNTNNDCQHTDAAGRRCRMQRANGDDAYCLPHRQQQLAQADTEDLAADLLGPINDFKTASAINLALGNLFALTAVDRVSPRKAAILAYIAQLLLGSLPSVRREETLAENRAQLVARLEGIRDAKAKETSAGKLAGEISREALGDQNVAAPEPAPSSASSGASPGTRPWPIPLTSTGNRSA